MDNITHSLTGLLLSRAGLNRLTPRAPWILVLAANAPDVDLVSATGGSLNFLHYHRHITHALITLPVLALACVLVVRLVSRKPLRWTGAYLVSLIGVASHLLLDLTNIYGVRLLLPFSGRWFRLDITGVIDFWIWGVLLLATFAPMLARLVNAEIGAQGPSGSFRGFAIFGLLFFLMYDGTRYVLHERAVATLDARVYASQAPQRVAAFPSSANPFHWRGLAETTEMFVMAQMDLLNEFDPSTGRTFYKPEPSTAIEAARQTPVFQEFLRFSQYPFWQTTPAEQPANAIEVDAMDLRFGDPQSPAFVATTFVDAQNRPLSAGFQFGKAKPR